MTDMQQRMKQEEERLAKLDPWKVMQNVVCDDQLFVWRKGFFLFLIVNSYLCCKVVDFIMSFHARVKFFLCRPSSSSLSGEKGMLPCF